MNTTRLNPLINPLITITAAALVVWLLVTQKIIFMPMALGLLFAFFILPATRKLEKHGVPRILSNIIMLLLSLALVVGVGILLSFAISQFAQEIPAQIPAIESNIATTQQFIAGTLRIPLETQSIWFQENVNLLSIGAQSFSTVATSIGKIATILSLTFIYAFFILYYRNKAMHFLQKLLGSHDETIILKTLKKLASIVPNYLSGVVWVMFILAIVNSAGFMIIGVPSPIFFGVLVAILNVIPYAGPIIGFATVVLFSLAAAGPGVALAVIIMFIIVQFLENNILTPNIAGGTINVNPLAAIVGIIIGGVMWGVVGMVIALPFLGMLKVICDSTPKLEAFGYLIGDTGTDEHALSWTNIKRVFKK